MENFGDVLKRVMVVDDDIETLDFLTRLLTKSGYEVVAFDNAFDAFEELLTKTYPVVLSDILMPGKSGQEFIRDVLDLVKGSQIVLMTAYSSVDRVLDAYQEGASDYLLKPFDDYDEVISVVERAVTRFSRWFLAIQKTYATRKATREDI